MVVLAGQHGHTVMVTYPYAFMTYIVSPLAGLGGAYRVVAAAHLQLVLVVLLIC